MFFLTNSHDVPEILTFHKYKYWSYFKFCKKNNFPLRKCPSKDLIWLHEPHLTYTVMYCQQPHNSSHCPKTALAKPGEINGKNQPYGAGASGKTVKTTNWRSRNQTTTWSMHWTHSECTCMATLQRSCTVQLLQTTGAASTREQRLSSL